jgi:DNA repair photolyase
MSRETHLKRGTCCKNGCVYCPWYVRQVRPPMEPWSELDAAFRSDEPVTIYTKRKSLVDTVTLANVTIVYNQ